MVKDPLRTAAFGIPQGAFQVLWILTGTYLASRFRNIRTYIMTAYLIPTVVGISLIWKLDRTHGMMGVLFGYYICGSFVASLVLSLQMPATNLGGYTKRTTATAVVFAAYCAGNVIGPHAFLDSEQPTYPSGCKLILACSAAQMCIALALRLLLIRRNKRRDQATGPNEGVEGGLDEVSADLTDFEVSYALVSESPGTLPC